MSNGQKICLPDTSRQAQLRTLASDIKTEADLNYYRYRLLQMSV